MKIEKDSEKILNEFSKILEDIPDLEETNYIMDSVNLTREDIAIKQNPEKIMKNAKTDKDGNVIVKKADWIN